MARLTLLQLRHNLATKVSSSFSTCYDDTSFQDMSGSAGHLGSDAKVHAQTGYPVQLLDHFWHKFKGEMDEFRPKRGKDRTKCYFYSLWCWIHSGCNSRNICRTLFTPQTGFISETTFRVRLKPMMAKIASLIDEIHWENRLDHDNHSLFFPRSVTGIVDCAPIRVQTPKRSRASRKLYQPKYGYAVLKVQVVISLKGEVIYASFPHAGTMHEETRRK